MNDEIIKSRVPTAGKPGKMTTVFPFLEKYWNFVTVTGNAVSVMVH